MATEIYSKGTWTVLTQGGAWSQASSVILQIEYTNDTTRSVVVKSLTVPLGSGKGTVYGSSTGEPPYHAINCSGDSFSVKAVANGVEYTGTVTGVVEVASIGSETSSGYFVEVSDTSTYQVNFSPTSDLLVVSAGNSVVFNISKVVNGGSSTLSIRKPLITSAETEYEKNEGQPPTPDAPSSSNLTVISPKMYATHVSVNDTTWSGATGCQYQLVSPSGVGSGWSTYDGTLSVDADSYSKIQFRLYNQTIDSNYEIPESDKSYSEVKEVLIKLNAPSVSYTIPSTGGYTIGEEIVVTGVPESNNPFGLSYEISYSNNGGGSPSGSYIGSGNLINHTLVSSSTVFRSSVSKEGYESSDPSDWSPVVPVYYEPRDMSFNGFTYSFESDGSTITASTVVVPGSSLSASWSSFLPSKHLGRFNYFKLSLINVTTNETITTNEEFNNPSSGSSSSFELGSELAGASCKLRLECLCYYEGSYYGPDDSAVFESPDFSVGGMPEVSIIYPSTSKFSSCNNRVRIIFDVDNPYNFNDKDITDVTVRVKTSSSVRSYNYSNSSSRDNFFSTSTNKPDTLPSGTRLDFTLPLISDSLDGITFQIKCCNEFLEGPWTSPITLNYIDTAQVFASSEYIDSGRPLFASDMLSIYNWTVDVLKGYSNLHSSAWSDASHNLPDKGESGRYKVQDGPYRSESGTISLLKSVYDLVKEYSVPPEGHSIDLSKINTNSSGEFVESAKPPFTVSSSGEFIPLGNYFNYILYILKNML